MSYSRPRKEYDEVQSGAFEVKLKELNLPKAVELRTDTPMSEVIEYFLGDKSGLKKTSMVIVKGDDQTDNLIGVFSERDFIKKGVDKLFELTSSSQDLVLKDFLTTPVVSLKDEDTVADALKLMALKDFRHIPIYVQEANEYLMLSVRNLLEFIVKFFPRDVSDWGPKKDWSLLEVNIQDENFSFCPKEQSLSGSIFYYPIKRAIYKEALRFNIGTPVLEVLEAMKKRNIGAAVITKYDSLIMGIFTESDLISKVIQLPWEKIQASCVEKFMTKGPDTLMEKHIISFAINNMFHYNYRRIIVVNEDRYPLSVVSLLDILKFIGHQIFLTD